MRLHTKFDPLSSRPWLLPSASSVHFSSRTSTKCGAASWSPRASCDGGVATVMRTAQGWDSTNEYWGPWKNRLGAVPVLLSSTSGFQEPGAPLTSSKSAVKNRQVKSMLQRSLDSETPRLSVYCYELRTGCDWQAWWYT